MLPALFARSMTFTAAGDIAQTNALKTSIATSASAASYSGVALNGTNTVGRGVARLVSWPTATASSHASSYVNGSTIRFTGTYGGEAAVRTATVVGTDGNATFIADGPLDIGSVTLIEVGAQADTSGAWTFGWSGLGPARGKFWKIVAREAGSIVIAADDGVSDTILLPVHGEHLSAVSRVYATTTIDFTAYE